MSFAAEPNSQQNFLLGIVESFPLKMMGDILARGPSVHRQTRQDQSTELTKEEASDRLRE